MTDGQIDRDAWRRTVFLPMSLISDGRTYFFPDEDGFTRMIAELQKYADARGMTQINTRILTHVRVSDNVSTITAIRDHIASEEKIASASLTFTTIRAGKDWRVSHIHFNDHRADTSAMTQILRQSGED